MISIHRLTGTSGLSVITFVCSILFTQIVQAQFVPRPYYGGGGAWGAATSAYQSAAQQQVYQQNREMQMQSSMARSSAWQGVNRSMQAQAASRPTSVPTSAQEARDWMFQHSAPSQPSRSNSRPVSLPPVSMRSTAPAADTKAKSAPKEIMIWPTLLKDPLFNADRAAVEDPFRRAYSDDKPLTVADYDGIIKTVIKMKVSLKSFESQMIESEYASVEEYLDSLIEDAQKRINAREDAK